MTDPTPTREALARAIFTADPDNQGLDFDECAASEHERPRGWVAKARGMAARIVLPALATPDPQPTGADTIFTSEYVDALHAGYQQREYDAWALGHNAGFTDGEHAASHPSDDVTSTNPFAKHVVQLSPFRVEGDPLFTPVPQPEATGGWPDNDPTYTPEPILWHVQYADATIDCDGIYPLTPHYVLACCKDAAHNRADEDFDTSEGRHSIDQYDTRPATPEEILAFAAALSPVPQPEASPAMNEPIPTREATIGEISQTILEELDLGGDAHSSAIGVVEAVERGDISFAPLHPEVLVIHTGDQDDRLAAWNAGYAEATRQRAAIDAGESDETVSGLAPTRRTREIVLTTLMRFFETSDQEEKMLAGHHWDEWGENLALEIDAALSPVPRIAETGDEWEYGVRAEGDDDPYTDITTDLDWLSDGTGFEGDQLVRRHPAGPWLPVPTESDPSHD